MRPRLLAAPAARAPAPVRTRAHSSPVRTRRRASSQRHRRPTGSKAPRPLRRPVTLPFGGSQRPQPSATPVLSSLVQPRLPRRGFSILYAIPLALLLSPLLLRPLVGRLRAFR
jgi:hypothetical protein